MKKYYSRHQKIILYLTLLIQIVLITGIGFYDDQKIQNDPDSLSILLRWTSFSIMVTIMLCFMFSILLFLCCCVYSAIRTKERDITKSLEQTIKCIVPITTVIMMLLNICFIIGFLISPLRGFRDSSERKIVKENYKGEFTEDNFETDE